MFTWLRVGLVFFHQIASIKLLFLSKPYKNIKNVPDLVIILECLFFINISDPLTLNIIVNSHNS